ncbi:MAG TPA: SBBP repeat-containing protein, partial [Blastocatellia bacterium]
VYLTYLGGSGIDGGTGIAVDPGGSVYVTGFTGSADFPTANSLQSTFGGGSFESFAAKLNASGSALEYSTYLGGSGIDSGFGIAADLFGNAYVMGQTNSTNLQTASPLQAVYGGGSSDVFVAKIRPDLKITGASLSGKQLIVTGSGFDNGAKILVNSQPQKTANDDQHPGATLVSKKAGKNIGAGQSVTLQVQDSDGSLSNEFIFTRATN